MDFAIESHIIPSMHSHNPPSIQHASAKQQKVSLTSHIQGMMASATVPQPIAPQVRAKCVRHSNYWV